MPTFIALLRGVNVGKAKRVPMAELRALLSDLGYTDVSTLLNSGNAVFRAKKGAPARHAADISAAVADHLHVEVPVVVTSAKDLATIVRENPITVDQTEHARFLVAFVQDPRTLSGLEEIEALAAPPEQFGLGTKAAYLLCAAGILKSDAGKALLDRTGGAVTTRNWATVLKLHARAEQTDA